ncbi:leucine zipper domain-containing protein [Variovorax paradoxus]|uniref:leucine zipper domain-containing protein n=1 Tax=Variovorax paradoxus TaxID=34073 RepID=UPI0030CB4CDC
MDRTNRAPQQGWTVRAASKAGGVSVRTADKWLAPFEPEGAQGLADLSSRPRRWSHAIAEGDRVRFEALPASGARRGALPCRPDAVWPR